MTKEIDFSNILEIRKAIQAAGAEIYDTFRSGVIKNIAGEFMALNENYVFYEVNTAGGLTVGCEEILKTGFTTNQRDYLGDLFIYQKERLSLRDNSGFPYDKCLVTNETGAYFEEVRSPQKSKKEDLRRA